MNGIAATVFHPSLIINTWLR